ncbi:hypothetical protein [Alcanivorax sp. 1008]|uniref:hypothetical protein n=1 Tax=Alcanivorax sp. 1008 TaxID=2816853 RepID=UPI001D3B4B17|nr:hypothetical protein [Alcanivorax sp. 1008]MCC1496816.1 hypothetical protein [Alcanivorax sp. 1008]
MKYLVGCILFGALLADKAVANPAWFEVDDEMDRCVISPFSPRDIVIQQNCIMDQEGSYPEMGIVSIECPDPNRPSVPVAELPLEDRVSRVFLPSAELCLDYLGLYNELGEEDFALDIEEPEDALDPVEDADIIEAAERLGISLE